MYWEMFGPQFQIPFIQYKSNAENPLVLNYCPVYMWPFVYLLYNINPNYHYIRLLFVVIQVHQLHHSVRMQCHRPRAILGTLFGNKMHLHPVFLAHLGQPVVAGPAPVVRALPGNILKMLENREMWNGCVADLLPVIMYDSAIYLFHPR